MQYVIVVAQMMIGVSLILALFRVVRGPSLTDRVVALELFSTLVAGMVGVQTIASDVAGFLDVAIVIALMGFLASIGFARFVERGGVRHD